MFDKKTVFVVGAGASYEVGFPLGSRLTEVIADKLDLVWEYGRQIAGDREVYEAIQALLVERGERDPNVYTGLGRTMEAGLQHALSIDNYLDAHSHDEDRKLLGKLGIAASILESERASRLYNDGDAPSAAENGLNTWFQPLFGMLSEGVSLGNLDALFSNVSVICFNYDRCIERFLPHALSAYYGVDERRAHEVVAKLQIVHPYGQIGRLPNQPGTSPVARFGAAPAGRELLQLARQLRTFSERVEDRDLLQNMRNMLTEAEVVVYLGFSYGRMNLELLEVRNATGCAVFGTCFGVSGPNRAATVRRICRSLGQPTERARNMDLSALTCTEFLSSYREPILEGRTTGYV